ncbi:uncharacterized protein LOC131686839 [Topomyia yanbarensis]|uniref:uncharacterized protein LOC131686839 n=1 Tax=Topomyia yanbarensis TaxID=2498891 RepID=UPI00273BD240|nr:uncharacterized protein LOC131686839 [Topomyia yanbarensis]
MSKGKGFSQVVDPPSGTSCRICQSPDNSRMVCCDECSQWHHFKCVGVDEKIAYVDWSCTKCIEAKAAQGAFGFSTPLAPGSTDQQESLVSQARLAEINDLRGKLNQLQRRFDEQQNSYEQRIREKELEVERSLLRQQHEFDQRLQALETRRITPNANSTVIPHVNNVPAPTIPNITEQIEQQLTVLAEKQALERKHLEERLQLHFGVRNSVPGPGSQTASQNGNVPEYIPSTYNAAFPSFDEPFELSRSQLAARQAIAKDLPFFTGDPEEWPLFIASYENSTRMCGFSEEENLLRLQRSLKGKALEAVRSRLLYPSGLGGVINTLRTLFGRPEIIVHSLICRIRDMPPPKAEKLNTLIDFGVAVQNMCATIKACGLQEHLCNVALLQELVERLPPTVKLTWAMHRQQMSAATLSDFSDWLGTLVEAACIVTIPPTVPTYGMKTEKRICREDVHVHVDGDSVPTSSNTMVSEPAIKECVVCRGVCSSPATCKKFLALTTDDRWMILKQQKLCRKCLKKHFGTCEVKKSCGRNGCSYMHNELLHDDTRYQPKIAQTQYSERQATITQNTHIGSVGRVLFRYVPVIIHGRGTSVRTYAFLDDGSSATLMEHSLLKELRMEGEPQSLCLNWTSNQHREEKDSVKLSLEISGINSESKTYLLPKVHTVGHLALPRQSVSFDDMARRYSHLQGLRIESYSNVSPRILIGIDNCRLGHAIDSHEGDVDEPTATKTRLGWLVYGPCSFTPSLSAPENAAHHSFHICPCSKEVDANLQMSLKEYFSLDSMGVADATKLMLSKDGERANKLLTSLTQVKGDRYETGLLWKYDNVKLPESRTMALKRLVCLEKRMQKDPNLLESLKRHIHEYEQKGYIRRLTPVEAAAKPQRCWYLPIFPVQNPNKPHKLRIVWDAAASVAGISLSSLLLTGPDQLASLLSVLHKFREFRVAITGDIREMFHQVMVNETDQQCQRFLWRDGDSSRHPDVFIMKVMTFGATCSPSCAQFVKNHNAQQFENQFPRAVEAIVDEHYVDDMLSSVESEEEAIKLAKDVHFIHAQAGFEIRHWLSNSQHVIEALNAGLDTEKSLNIGNEPATEKILGMWWCTTTDSFTFKVSPRIDRALLSGKAIPTKRQEIWRSGIAWDEPIREEQWKKWQTWLDALPLVERVNVPRCYRTITSASDTTVIQLHVFVDASENGFAAVAYFRFKEGDRVECALIGSKTRVAPLRFVSIPKLELQAAVLGARLANSIVESHKLKPSQRFFWTDSRDVICWLNSDHRRYSQFVAFRVSELLDSTDVSEWNWISTNQNVADEATKWRKVPSLEPSSRWFHAPDFLWKLTQEFPLSNQNFGTTSEELRAHSLHHLTREPSIKFEDFSSWIRLVRRIAFICRFPRNIRSRLLKQAPVCGPLTKDEFIAAEIVIYKLVQSTSFAEELQILGGAKTQSGKTRRTLPKGSSLYKLNPALDTNGILRMLGRIDACEYVDETTKHPILLPKKHHVTDLLIANIHERYLHQNHQTTLNEVRTKYYVPSLRSVYRRVRRSCQHCKIKDALPQPPIMGNLPPMRLKAFSRPFSYIGIDYFGPMQVVLGRRVEKRWGVLITCMTTRAIHLELAHSLTTDSCILALRNFIARRGMPIEIISDRGTNFIGASRVLKEALKNIDQEKLMKHFVSVDTKWSFNPPASPHFGGCWERLIQSVKKALDEIKQKRLPTDELLRNMLAEIEMIINSRPLTELPLEEEISEPLTPNHLLLGSSNGSKPPITFDDSGAALNRTWKMSQVYANEFWKRWVAEYLPTLTRRAKWFQPVKPIAVGDIVVIVDNDFPRNCWPKGRVIDVSMSKDGQVRRATVQTSTGVFERPAVKLAVLDVGSINSTSD